MSDPNEVRGVGPEAWRKTLEAIAHFCDHPEGMDDPYSPDGHLLAAIARAALDAPLKPWRNCDRAECLTYGAAIRTFEEEAEDGDDIVEWLLAPVQEKEGGEA